MRKQTKIAAIVSAAALLALGASITSFAAVKGTWRIEDGEWKCYDKNGEVYENVFATSNGKEYYVGEDGLLVRSDWVEYDGSYYFVNSAGQKITNDWRLTTPYDEPDEEEQWYYFQSSGKRAENKKITWKNKTYYFDTDGKMLTGWVTTDGNNAVNEANGFVDGSTYFCDETGARVVSGWVEYTEPGVEADDADADTYFYYMKSSGKATTGKAANIEGRTYFFDDQGRMLTGWVAEETSDNSYYQLYKEDEEAIDIANYFSGNPTGAVYYVGDSDKGYAKKNRWIKLWAPGKIETEEESDLKWFWFDKNGKLYAPIQGNKPDNAVKYVFEDGKLNYDGDSRTDALTYIEKKKINSKDYWFTTEGTMVSGFYMVGTKMFYFGGVDDGSMKTGSQSIKDDAGDTYKFYFSSKTGTKGEGITGNQSNKLYYYGRLVQAQDYKYQIAGIDMDGDTIEDTYFIVNANGSIQHNNSQYKEDGDVLIDARNVKKTQDPAKESDTSVIGQYVEFDTATTAGAKKYAIVENQTGNPPTDYNHYATAASIKKYGAMIDVNDLIDLQ